MTLKLPKFTIIQHSLTLKGIVFAIKHKLADLIQSDLVPEFQNECHHFLNNLFKRIICPSLVKSSVKWSIKKLMQLTTIGKPD